MTFSKQASEMMIIIFSDTKHIILIIIEAISIKRIVNTIVKYFDEDEVYYKV